MMETLNLGCARARRLGLYRLEKSWNHLVHVNWYTCDRYTSSHNPIIIGGSARSGTTLLRVILDSHQNLYCGPESNLFNAEDNRNSRRITNLSVKFGISKKTIKKMINQSQCETEFIELFFSHLLSFHKKERWVEKTPKNVRRIGDIFNKFPQAKFIHMIRDGRDVSCSLMHHPKNKLVNGKIVPLNTNKPLDQCIEQWANDVKLGLNWRTDPRYCEIKYEDLIITSEKALRKLFVFLDEPYAKSLLRYYERDLDRMSFVTSPEATKPMSTSSFERWKNEFSENDKILFKQLAGELLIDLGYEVNSDW